MTDTTDKAAAKALLGRAFRTEPPLDMDSRALLRQARRRLSRRRAMVTAAATVGVVAAAVGAVALAGSDRTVLPATTSVPPNPTTTLPTSSTPTPPGDERSQRLTSALAGLVPQGMTAEREGARGPFEFFSAGGDSYQAYARLRDSRGYGKVVFNITRGQPVNDVRTCAAVLQAKSCSENTLPDGSKTRIYTIAGPVSVPGSVLKRLTVLRPNGSFMEVYVDNAGTLPNPGSPPAPPSRDEPPLTDDTLLKIAQIQDLTY